MTSFSRQTHDDEWGSLVWELRSVNHRFLEISLRCPDHFRDQEMAIRQCVQQQLSRGKVEATLKFVPGAKLPMDFSVNMTLLENLSKAGKQVRSYFPDAQINAADLLSWKGVLQVVEADSEALNQNMLALLESTLKKLVDMRSREGEGLSRFLQENCKKIKSEAAKIEKALPEIINTERAKLKTRLSEAQQNFNPERLEQEMIIWAQRADVAEELQRLNAHLDEINRVLKKGGVIGRRLDFLMQELNREANTLCSKSLDTVVTQSAVEIKVLIEQMREQVQNIE